MPLHLDALTDLELTDEMIFALVNQDNDDYKQSGTSKDKRIILMANPLIDLTTKEKIGKFVFTFEIYQRTKQLMLIDIDITLDSPQPIKLDFIERLPMSSLANEYYLVSVGDEGPHLQIETVNRHAVELENLEDTTQAVYISAFPFSLSIYDDLDELNDSLGMKKTVVIAGEEYKLTGFDLNFMGTGDAFGAKEGETFTFLVGTIVSYRIVRIDIVENIVDFVLAEVSTALGTIPCAISRSAFDLKKLSTGKVLAMKADIKADFLK